MDQMTFVASDANEDRSITHSVAIDPTIKHRHKKAKADFSNTLDKICEK